MLLALALVAIAALVGVTLALRTSLERERRLARTDVVTGVRTARAFYEAAAAEIERARRYQHPFSVAAVHLGHRVPDELLRATAVALRLALRACSCPRRPPPRPRSCLRNFAPVCWTCGLVTVAR